VKNSSPTPDSDIVRFDHFMAEALYGPNGYYTSPRTILGSRGDFTTTPKLTKLLAKKIATWIESAWKRQGQNLPVIELGPGDGTLANDIGNSLGFFARRKLDYHFVEISPHLAKRQQEKNKGTWHTTLGEALVVTRGSALIISNEFFDAFPVRIFNQALDELYLGPNKEEIWRPCHKLPDSALLGDPPARFEHAGSIQQWFRRELSQMKAGQILTIDYGGGPDEIYHRRPLGTIRAYAHHMRFLPPEAYQNPGKQDLTFDVNFSELIRWGKEIGLEKTSLMTQAEFLGTDDVNGAGGAFKVLHQRKRSADDTS
jgi:SAM-dependent MidA family methyltransferase